MAETNTAPAPEIASRSPRGRHRVGPYSRQPALTKIDRRSREALLMRETRAPTMMRAMTSCARGRKRPGVGRRHPLGCPGKSLGR